MATERTKTGWGRTLLTWSLLLFGAFAFQTAAAKRFYIPSASMMPALVKGDELVVTKYPYGWSYASLPIHGGAVVPGRVLGTLPERGDIVTVARRGDGSDLIKRVIGLPGDTIEVRAGVVVINGTAVPRVARGRAMIPVDGNLPCTGPLGPYREARPDGTSLCRLPLYRETLPNGARYDTIDLGTGYPADDFGPVAVPRGHVFLMGDNRDQSADSRYPLEAGGLGGPVPVETLSGRAEFITHSLDGSSNWNPASWLGALRGGRAGSSLRPEHAD